MRRHVTECVRHGRRGVRPVLREKQLEVGQCDSLLLRLRSLLFVGHNYLPVSIDFLLLVNIALTSLGNSAQSQAEHTAYAPARKPSQNRE
jgi:hypothetical protein